MSEQPHLKDNSVYFLHEPLHVNIATISTVFKFITGFTVDFSAPLVSKERIQKAYPVQHVMLLKHTLAHNNLHTAVCLHWIVY